MRYRLRTLLILLAVGPMAIGSNFAAYRLFMKQPPPTDSEREVALILAIASAAVLVGQLATAFDFEPTKHG
jgi:hypothetical protein